MTILELIAAHPTLFRTDQTWYRDEAFVRLDLPRTGRMPSRVRVARAINDPDCLTDAVLLLGLYVLFPDDPMWDRYLWCADTDRHGQRVFIGKNEGLMEIHRHLHITERFGIPVWD